MSGQYSSAFALPELVDSADPWSLCWAGAKEVVHEEALVAPNNSDRLVCNRLAAAGRAVGRLRWQVLRGAAWRRGTGPKRRRSIRRRFQVPAWQRPGLIGSGAL